MFALYNVRTWTSVIVSRGKGNCSGFGTSRVKQGRIYAVTAIEFSLQNGSITAVTVGGYADVWSERQVADER
jgi:hypothetical protein